MAFEELHGLVGRPHGLIRVGYSMGSCHKRCLLSELSTSCESGTVHGSKSGGLNIGIFIYFCRPH